MIPFPGDAYRVTGRTETGYDIDEIVEISDDEPEELFFSAETLHYIINPRFFDYGGWTQMKTEFPSFLDGTHEFFKFEKINLDDYPEFRL